MTPLNTYGKRLFDIFRFYGIRTQLAEEIALNLQERGWAPYSAVASSPTAQQSNFSERV